jgi:hypothetical protein
VFNSSTPLSAPFEALFSCGPIRPFQAEKRGLQRSLPNPTGKGSVWDPERHAAVIEILLSKINRLSGLDPKNAA